MNIFLPSDDSESDTEEATDGDDKLDGFGDRGLRDLKIITNIVKIYNFYCNLLKIN